jgi:hypothetical protein
LSACIFCGGPATSKEHAWPDWLLSIFSTLGSEAVIRAERDGAPDREWRGPKPSVKVKRVCVPCNTGWMAALENEARPFLLPLLMGREVTLSGQEQLTIATWSVKTAIVFDCTRTSERLYFSQQERDYLFQARAKGALCAPFPPNTFVWLATYDGVNTLTCIASALFGVSRGWDRRDVRIGGHVATISAGCFVTQVLIERLPPEHEHRLPPHDASGRWERATRRIWPLVSGRMRMPPEQRLDDGPMSLDDFTLRWPAKTTSPRAARSRVR